MADEYDPDSVPPFSFGDEFDQAWNGQGSSVLPASALGAIKAFEGLCSDLPPAWRPRPLSAQEREKAQARWMESFRSAPPPEYFDFVCSTNGMALDGAVVFPVLDGDRIYKPLQTTVYRENFGIYGGDPDEDPRDLDIVFARLSNGAKYGFNLLRGIYYSSDPGSRKFTEYGSFSEQLGDLCSGMLSAKASPGVLLGNFRSGRDIESEFGLPSGTLRAEGIGILFAAYRVDYGNPECSVKRAFVLFRQDGRLNYLQASMAHDSYGLRGFWDKNYIARADVAELAGLLEEGKLYSVAQAEDREALGACLEALAIKGELDAGKAGPAAARKASI